jgi:PAS domain S-box-containing protein
LKTSPNPTTDDAITSLFFGQLYRLVALQPNKQFNSLMKRWFRLTTLFLAWAILGLPGLVGAEQQSPLRVGSRNDFPPYADVDAQGQSTGFAVELFAAVAEVMNIPFSFQPGSRDTNWQSLKAGELDALPLVSRLQEREGQVEFTEPHTIGYDTFFTHVGHKPIASIDQARGLSIIVVRSDTAHEALASRGFTNQLVVVNDLADGLRLLASGQHDAVLAPSLQGKVLIHNIGLEKIVIAGPLLKEYRREFAFAVRKGDTVLRGHLDQGLAIVKANGEYDRLYRKWLDLHEEQTFPVRYVIWGAGFAIGLLVLLGLCNWALRRRVALRTDELNQANASLERRVAERTAELETARQEAEAAHDLLRVTMDNAPALMSYIDKECRFRYSDEQTRGRHMRDILGETVWQAIVPYVQRVLAGEQVAFELQVSPLKSSPRWVHTTYSPDFDAEGQVRGFVAHVLDITDQKQAEEALKENDHRKDEFLAMLAHELRNPLAPISNAVQILKRSSLDETRLVWCRDIIERQVEQLVRLVDDLLDVSRISRGKIELKKEILEVSTVVQRAVETSQSLIDTHRHTFTVQLPPEPFYIEGDLTRLSQVVSNLLNNAAKYTDEEGSICLTVEPADHDLLIRVRDNGRGIEPSALPGLFELFYQVDRTLDRSEGGLGIGLSLVKSLVTMHGGEVWAHSAGRGQGSEFFIRLPCLLSSPIAPDPSPTEPKPIQGPLRILVVDDNCDAAQSLSLLLTSEGHTVRLAYSGPAGLIAGLTERPQVVLLDIGLPGMDGYAVARALRRHPELKMMHLIALSGYGREVDREQALAAGFNFYLTKPVDFDKLQRALVPATISPSDDWLSQGSSIANCAYFSKG